MTVAEENGCVFTCEDELLLEALAPSVAASRLRGEYRALRVVYRTPSGPVGLHLPPRGPAVSAWFLREAIGWDIPVRETLSFERAREIDPSAALMQQGEAPDLRWRTRVTVQEPKAPYHEILGLPSAIVGDLPTRVDEFLTRDEVSIVHSMLNEQALLCRIASIWLADFSVSAISRRSDPWRRDLEVHCNSVGVAYKALTDFSLLPEW